MTKDIKVKLRDAEGKLVTEVEIPSFVIAPTAIAWSDRVFIRKSRGNYWECFAHVIPTN